MNEYYRKDLAFIHDVGFAEWALGSAPGILRILDQSRIREGLVVDMVFIARKPKQVAHGDFGSPLSVLR
ncbi:MAG: hypothetical protein WAU45_10030 [Blastocatellia bacterium]